MNQNTSLQIFSALWSLETHSVLFGYQDYWENIDLSSHATCKGIITIMNAIV